jgi:hypothetical protein
MIVLSDLDAYCIGKILNIHAVDLTCEEIIDKRMDYNLSLEEYPIMRYCLPVVGAFLFLD